MRFHASSSCVLEESRTLESIFSTLKKHSRRLEKPSFSHLDEKFSHLDEKYSDFD